VISSDLRDPCPFSTADVIDYEDPYRTRMGISIGDGVTDLRKEEIFP
jgi:hypothetical protein